MKALAARTIEARIRSTLICCAKTSGMTHAHEGKRGEEVAGRCGI